MLRSIGKKRQPGHCRGGGSVDLHAVDQHAMHQPDSCILHLKQAQDFGNYTCMAEVALMRMAEGVRKAALGLRAGVSCKPV